MDNLAKKLNNCDLAGEEKKPKLGMKPLAPKLDKNPNGTPVTITTNLRQLDLLPNMAVYKYAVSVLCTFRKNDGTEDEVDMTTYRSGSEARERNKDRCQKAFLLAVNQCPELSSGGSTFYDRQANLYSLRKLTLKGDVRVELNAGVATDPKLVKTTIVIKAVSDTYQATSNDLKKIVNSCPGLADKTLPEAISIILSAPAYSNPDVVTVGNCVHYILDTTGITCFRQINTDCGYQYSALGVSKGVKCLEGTNKDKPSLYMSTEMKASLFHPDEIYLLDLMSTFERFDGNLRADSQTGKAISNAYKGIEFYLVTKKGITDFSNCPIHKITGFSSSANETKFLLGEEEMTVASYFKEKYEITLQYPNLMTATARGRDGIKIHLPVELLVICPSQKVTTEQMDKRVQADMIRMSAAKPKARMEGTQEIAKRAGIGADQASGFIKIQQPEKVEGTVLVKPKISFSGNKIVQLEPNADFRRTGGFVQPKKLTNWEIVFQKNMIVHDVKKPLMKEMQDNGMTSSEPVITIMPGDNFQAVFEKAKQNERQLLMFILDDKSTYHATIKALEQSYDVLTQELHFSTAKNIFTKPQTRQNIINKMNMKLGGLNYLISSPGLMNPNILFIGFESSSKGGSGDGPISVGFAANMLDHHQKFAGGYIYVKRARDIFGEMIEEALASVFKASKFSGRGKPEELVIYFNGVTEGQYAMINEEYVPKIQKACAAVSPSFTPPLTIIASSKTHNERFYLTGGKEVSNLLPGTVVDHTIVSPVLSEFYLTSAVARQGTAKSTKFTLIHATKPDETLERIESLTNDLCYDHQIVFQPVGLPVPLFIAGRYSQRGAAILGFRGVRRGPDGEIDYKALNEQYGYQKKNLFIKRFNA